MKSWVWYKYVLSLELIVNEIILVASVFIAGAVQVHESDACTHPAGMSSNIARMLLADEMSAHFTIIFVPPFAGPELG